MSAVVVHDEMHLKLRWDVGIDGAKKRQELCRDAGDEVPRLRCRSPHRARQTGSLFHGARNHGCGAQQFPAPAAASAACGPRPGSGLLIHTKHHRLGRRLEIQAHDIADLLNEQRIGGELERFASMRLKPKRSPARLTVLCETWSFLASSRVLQCVASTGRSFSVAAINCSIFASPCRGAPGRGSSSRLSTILQSCDRLTLSMTSPLDLD